MSYCVLIALHLRCLHSFINTIQDPEEIRGLISKMIASASEEIQILLFPSSNVLEIYWNEGLLRMLKEKAGAGKKNMIIRILVKKDDLIHQLIIRLFSQLENVLLLQSDSIDAKVVTMIVDKDMCLVIEMKDDLESSIAESAALLIRLITKYLIPVCRI